LVTSDSLPVVYSMVPGGLRDSVVLPAVPSAIAADTAGNYAYVTSLRDDVAVELDLAEVATTRQVTVGAGLAGVAVSPDGLFYYVAVAGENRLAVVDRAPDMPTQSLDIPGKPWGVAIADLGRPELLDTGVVVTARELSLDEFAELIEAPDVVLINVQAEPEGEIEGTDLVVSYGRLLDTLRILDPDRTDVLAVYCREGAVSGDAALALAEAGYADVCWLRDGYNRWVARGMPFRVYRANRR
ncbi:hypothetical protein JXB37_04435, partial [candidate division WOR-3 bacterium]|nr:hypothetical protein [candidate division WOR-3 bacterium]